MKLKNTIKITREYQGKTKFDFWLNIKENDLLEISLKLSPTGHGYGGRIYAPLIYAENLRTGEKFGDTINLFQKYLGKISYIEQIN